jgi:hypothetical protein
MYLTTKGVAMKKDTIEVPVEALEILVQNAELGFAGSESHSVVHEAIAVLQAAGIKSVFDTSTGGSNFRNH